MTCQTEVSRRDADFPVYIWSNGRVSDCSARYAWFGEIRLVRRVILPGEEASVLDSADGVRGKRVFVGKTVELIDRQRDALVSFNLGSGGSLSYGV